ncbi:hypothetical protein B0T10DRAFT_372450, partial [Thelonectria olida]
SISSVNPQGMPFGRKGKETSMMKYQSAGHRYLGFCLRAYWLGRKLAFERWAIHFTDEQWSLLCDVVYELEGGEGVASSHDSGFCGSGLSRRRMRRNRRETEEAEED